MTSKFLRMARGAVAALTLAALLPGMAAADSLRQAMADAYRNSQLLEQSRYLLRIDDEAVNQAFAALLPTVSFVAATSRDLVNDTSTTTFRLLGELAVYEGGSRINARLGAQEAVNAARQQLVSLEQQVLIDAVTAYLEVWEAIQIVEVRQRNVRVLTEQLRAARDRFEVGEDTRTDVAQAESQLATARSALAAAEGSLEIARELFNLAVGRYPGGLGGPGGLPHLPRSEDEAQRLARQVHPAVLARQFEVAAAEFGVAEARGASRPSVTLDLSVSETVQSPMQEGTGASIGLTLTQPIYRGGQLASLERQALAQVEAVRFGLNQQVLQNLQAVGNAYARLRIAQARRSGLRSGRPSRAKGGTGLRGRRREGGVAGGGGATKQSTMCGSSTGAGIYWLRGEAKDSGDGHRRAQGESLCRSYSDLMPLPRVLMTGAPSRTGCRWPRIMKSRRLFGGLPGGRPRVASPQG